MKEAPIDETEKDDAEDALAAKELEALGALKSAATDDAEHVERSVWPTLTGELDEIMGIKVRWPTLQTLILFSELDIELTSGVPVKDCLQPVKDAVRVLTMLRIGDRELTAMLNKDMDRFESLEVECATELPPSDPGLVVQEVVAFLNKCSQGRVKAELPEELKGTNPPKKKAARRRGP